MTTYRLYGMNILTPYPVGVPLDGDTADPDVVVSVLDEIADQSVDPLGDIIARLEGDRLYYRLYRIDSQRYLFRFYDLADIHIRLGSPTTVECNRTPGALEGRLEVILAGTVFAAVLMLNRCAVLHASAVERDGKTVAMVGNAGSGKSTLAAMACMSGAKLVTDDVLRVRSTEGSTLCYRGGSTIRLRPTSRALYKELSMVSEVSGDGRYLWKPETTSMDCLPLTAIQIVRLRSASEPFVTQRISPKRALLALLGCPRIQEWNDQATEVHILNELADLVAAVPVYLLDVPRGMQPDDRHLSDLSNAIFVDG